MTKQQYLSTKQVAMILGVSVSTVQNLVEKGLLQAWKTSGGHRRIHQESLRQLQHKYGTQPDNTTDLEALSPRSSQVRAIKPVVLVVEDDPFMLEVYRNALSKYSDHIVAKFCEEGISALLQIGAQKPNLLILDLNMPNVDGFEVLKSIQSSGYSNKMQILVVSGLSDKELAGRNEELSSFTFVKKPISAQFLDGYMACFMSSIA